MSVYLTEEDEEDVGGSNCKYDHLLDISNWFPLASKMNLIQTATVGRDYQLRKVYLSKSGKFQKQ